MSAKLAKASTFENVIAAFSPLQANATAPLRTLFNATLALTEPWRERRLPRAPRIGALAANAVEQTTPLALL
jgi:hypothetical protein